MFERVYSGVEREGDGFLKKALKSEPECALPSPSMISLPIPPQCVQPVRISEENGPGAREELTP